MTTAEEMRTAAAKLRADRPYGELDEPLAALLVDAAEDSEVIGTDFRALDIARLVNGGAS